MKRYLMLELLTFNTFTSIKFSFDRIRKIYPLLSTGNRRDFGIIFINFRLNNKDFSYLFHIYIQPNWLSLRESKWPHVP